MSIGTFSVIALDCPDPHALADFYSQITGWPVAAGARGNWVQLDSPAGATIAFQRVPHYVAPEWPGARRPQQLHLDFDVPDLDAGEAAVLAIGARKAEYQPGSDFRVFLDPAGHPFCLVLAD